MLIIPFAVLGRASFLSEDGQRKEAKEDRLFFWLLF